VIDERRHTALDTAIVAAVAGAIGFAAGLVRPSHQHAVETAQVLAGVVAYPIDTPFFVYHLRLWNLPSQLLAIGLAAGVPERALSVATSGLLGALSFQALSLSALAAGAGRWLAVVIAPWILATAAFFLGLVYDIMLIGTPHTHGAIGMSYALIVLSLLALGHFRVALVLLGLAPAVHPAVGSWAAGIGVLSLLVGGTAARAQLRVHLGWLAGGVGLAATSFAVQSFVGRELVARESPVEELALRAFLRDWDFHRRPVPLGERAIGLNAVFVAIAALWTVVPRLRERLPERATRMLRALGLSAALALVLAVATHWQDRLPVVLSIAMPGRLLNLTSLALAPVFVGLLGGRALGPSGAIGLLAVASVSLLFSLLSTAIRTPVWQVMALEAAVVVATLWHLVQRADAPRFLRPVERPARVLAVVLIAGVAFLRLDPDRVLFAALLAALAGLALVLDPRALGERLRPPLLRGVGAVLVACGAALGGARALELRGSPLDWLRDADNDAFFAEVARGDGLLVTASNLSQVQLRTRRPVLIDGSGLDGLPYSSSSAAELARILREVYGENLFRPSAAIRDARPGSLLPTTGAELWQRRSGADWALVARSFGFRDVVTPNDWDLALPKVAESKRMRLYRVPDAPAASEEGPPAAP
jgi:hypothetical protein